MGAKMTTVRERAPIATETVAPTAFHPVYKPSANNWYVYPESRAADPIAAYKPAANSWSKVPETRAPVAPPSKPANYTNQFIAFNSSSRWKAYIDSSKDSNKLIVIYFTATWCVPCKKMEPTLKEIAAKFTDVEFVKIDVDELFNVSREYGIQAMPTFLFMKKGKEVDRVVGARKEELQRKIEKNRV